jgi:NAD(P)-dependent dehydrogenase (short-subunit alcohol dehydrogenase family)
MAQWTPKDIPEMTGRRVVVTGANSGLGWYTALELARSGAETILTARSNSKGQEAVDAIRRLVPYAKLSYEILDLASLTSVRSFAERISRGPALDLLVNNAGIMNVPERRLTEDGFEMHLGTNFLGHFALTARLLPLLLRSSTPRVTTLSSVAVNIGLRRMRFEDLQWERGYGPTKAYAQSKLADLLFMQELGKRYGNALVSTGAHPGFARTNLIVSGAGREQPLQKFASWILAQDAEHGAWPTLRAATEPGLVSGAYIGPAGVLGLKGAPVAAAVPAPGRDLDAAKRLWTVSEELTGANWPAQKIT